MFETKWLAESMAKDCRVCVHLFQKLPESMYAWRPSDGQRTTSELLSYLSICAIAALKGFLEPDKGWRDHYRAQAQAMVPSRFPDQMEQQALEILGYFRDLPDDLLHSHRVRLPWGEELPLGQAILVAPAKWLPAYRMQLFLYAKANGIALSTANLWHGRDPVQ